jgi:hypothetical protein
MKHPEGRVLAIQQQMFFAGLLADQMDTTPEIILRKLSMAGFALIADINEVAVDAAAILPKLPDWRSPLRAVPDVAE